MKNRLFFFAGLEQNVLHAPRFAEFAPQSSAVAVPTNLVGLQGQIDERHTPLELFGRIDAALHNANTLNVELAGTRVRAMRIDDLSGDGEERTLNAATTAANEGGQGIFARAGLTTVIGAHSVNRAILAWTSDHRGISDGTPADTVFTHGAQPVSGWYRCRLPTDTTAP